MELARPRRLATYPSHQHFDLGVLSGSFLGRKPRSARCLLHIVRMLSSLFWFFASIFPFLEPEFSFPISVYENSTAVEALVAQLRVELVPPPLPSPPKAFYTPPQAGKDVSLNPAAVLGSRQTCTGGENNYCFGTTSWSCPSCGLCCTQASDFWCCPTTGAFCCNSAPGPTAGTTGGCCYNGDICGDNGCQEPTYVFLLLLRRLGEGELLMKD